MTYLSCSDNLDITALYAAFSSSKTLAVFFESETFLCNFVWMQLNPKLFFKKKILKSNEKKGTKIEPIPKYIMKILTK